MSGYEFLLIGIFLSYIEKIEDSFVIRENMGQRKPVNWHILHGEVIFIIIQFLIFRHYQPILLCILIFKISKYEHVKYETVQLEWKTLREKCSYSELFWSAFPHIRTEYGKMRTRITPNTDSFYTVKIFSGLNVINIFGRSFLWNKQKRRDEGKVHQFLYLEESFRRERIIIYEKNKISFIGTWLVRNSSPKVFCNKRILKNFAKFTRKHMCCDLFLVKSRPARSESLLKNSSTSSFLWILHNF